MVISKANVPNALTVLRVLLAALFFVFINVYDYPSTNTWAIAVCLVVFVAAAITDFFDGHLARSWKCESRFGRILDPAADKILIIGSLICLTGPRFADTSAIVVSHRLVMASGVYPWMVIVIFTRELLVTGIRAELESSGIKFGAKLAGKTKVLLQVIVVPSILILVWLDPNTPGREWITYVRDFILWATVIFTVGSGIPYFLSAVQLFLASGHKQIPSKAS